MDYPNRLLQRFTNSLIYQLDEDYGMGTVCRHDEAGGNQRIVVKLEQIAKIFGEDVNLPYCEITIRPLND